MKSPIWVALAVVGIGLLGVGSGFRNGDAAVYAWQALHGGFGERSIHIGYLGLAWVLGRVLGESLPTALDGVTAVAAGALVLAVGFTQRRKDAEEDLVAAAILGMSVLPLASFAEVDVLWVALILWSTTVRGQPLAAALLFAAATISPTALLAVPFVAVRRRSWWPFGVVLVAVVLLTAVSSGEWWFGDRGVLHASLDPARSLGAWVGHVGAFPLPLGFALVAAVRGRVSRSDVRSVLATLPLAFAPPDVPGWLVFDAELALLGARAVLDRKHLGYGLLALGSIAAIAAWNTERHRIFAEDRVIRHVASLLGPGDGLVAPWSWGVRVSILATRDPYALLWRPPRGWVRTQQDRWCNATIDQVAVLPPGQVWEGLTPLRADGEGVWWGKSKTLMPTPPGCEATSHP